MTNKFKIGEVVKHERKAIFEDQIIETIYILIVFIKKHENGEYTYNDGISEKVFRKLSEDEKKSIVF